MMVRPVSAAVMAIQVAPRTRSPSSNQARTAEMKGSAPNTNTALATEV